MVIQYRNLLCLALQKGKKRNYYFDKISQKNKLKNKHIETSQPDMKVPRSTYRQKRSPN